MGKETHFSRMRRRIWASVTTINSNSTSASNSKAGKVVDCQPCNPTVPPSCHSSFESVTIVDSIMGNDDDENAGIKEVRRRRRAEIASRAAMESTYVPKLLGDSPSRIFAPDTGDITMLAHIIPCIPVRYRNRDLLRVYSTATCGASLGTLYRNINNINIPVILVMRNSAGDVFGAYASAPFAPQAHYGGSGEAFLFDRKRAWTWSRSNHFFIFAAQDSLAFGNGHSESGSVAALWVDAELARGRTGRSDTFDNAPLARSEEFDIVVAEAYQLVLPNKR